MTAFSADSVKVVQDRLTLIKELINVRHHFMGSEKTESISDSQATHPYRHFHALTIYLSLTCFDILGQRQDWMDFGSWLKASRVKDEREEVFARHTGQPNSVTLILDDYNKMYGVKSGFNKFLREIVHEDRRRKLYASISVNELTYQMVKREDGSEYEGAAYNPIQIDDIKKEQFMFSARNNFTHKGLSYGNPSRGLAEFGPGSRFAQLMEHAGWKGPIPEQIYVGERKNNKALAYSVAQWPELLIETIASVL